MLGSCGLLQAETMTDESFASTTEKGNAFRDLVASILASGGYSPIKEVRADFKRVDIDFWGGEDMDGPYRVLVEAKDYGKTLGSDECRIFGAQSKQLLDQGLATKAWLISRGAVSPDGRRAIESDPRLRCYTFEQFQRQILRIDGYLRDLVAEYRREQIAEFYVRPYTSEGTDLEERRTSVAT